MGRAICRLLAREGASVVVADINPDWARETAEAIAEDGGTAITTRTDVSRADDVARMVAATLAAFGRIDILVNHAGAGLPARIEEMTEERWDLITGVHLKGTYLCTRAVVPHMKAQNGGRIVCTASRAAYRPSRGVLGLTAYSASKAAVIGFSRALAIELGPWNITVNCVAPGLVDGGGMDRDPATDLRSANMLTAASDNEGQMIHPLRFVDPQEIAGTWLYLVGPHAERVTGAIMHVNSGSYFGN
jgi:NAD(P)-dependent dehydrogenase (short-subunit alcohol dehydrogenase family)